MIAQAMIFKVVSLLKVMTTVHAKNCAEKPTTALVTPGTEEDQIGVSAGSKTKWQIAGQKILVHATRDHASLVSLMTMVLVKDRHWRPCTQSKPTMTAPEETFHIFPLMA